MASILFRMVNSHIKKSAGKPAQIAIQCIARAVVAEAGTLEATGVFYSGTAPAGKLPSSIRCIPKSAGDLSMTLTAAHVPAIVALIAGILILVMPRLLNFIVAIYLIFVGLVGLGVLRMFHF
jgi:hypothetical protein